MINALSLVACVLAMLGSWFAARGQLKPAYVLAVVNGLCYSVLNGALATAHVRQTGVALLIVPSLWGITMAVYGLVRISRKPGSE